MWERRHIFPSTLAMVLGAVASRSVVEILVKQQVTTLQSGIISLYESPFRFVGLALIVCSSYVVLLYLAYRGF
jgi:membrane glycosyltransferase